MPKWGRIIIMLAAMLTFSCSAPLLSPSAESRCPDNNAPSFDTAPVSAASAAALQIFEPAHLSLIENQARSAAVKVVRPFEDGHGSGTYVKIHGEFVVVTAAHVVGSYTTMIIEGRDDERVTGRVLYKDDDADLAVIMVPRLTTRTAAPWRIQKKKNNLIGVNVNYTGFPGRHDLLTLRGHVASLEHDMIVANLFGWFGSSGSGVFDQHGRFLGVVSGIDIGHWGLAIPLDSIVWIAPAWEFDEDVLEVRIKTAAPLEALNSFPGAAAPRRGTSRD